MTKPKYELGKIGHIKKPNEELKEQKQIRKNTFRNFINRKYKWGARKWEFGLELKIKKT